MKIGQGLPVLYVIVDSSERKSADLVCFNMVDKRMLSVALRLGGKCLSILGTKPLKPQLEVLFELTP